MNYQLEPEIAGSLGKGTRLDSNDHPPVVLALDYEFQGLPKDEILESFPCFIITQDLANTLIAADLTGFKIADCSVTKSEMFKELYPNARLPQYKWLKILGCEGKDDFFINHLNILTVTNKALTKLKKHSFESCKITRFSA